MPYLLDVRYRRTATVIRVIIGGHTLVNGIAPGAISVARRIVAARAIRATISVKRRASRRSLVEWRRG